ncbi:MAG: hypothetical protein ABIJ36_00565 [Patescibacteria group bacterium]|nr:hypothetical protein [Patescibacteria group bacterium]
MTHLKYFGLGLFLGILVVGTVTAVKAYLTKEKVLGESSVSTATLDLSTTSQSALLSFEGITPGFSSGEKLVTLKNTGTADLKYRVSIEPTNVSDNNDLYKTLEYSLYEYDDNAQKTKTLGGEGALLKDLQDIEITQTLDSGQEKKLGIEISLPQEVSNEIQGLTTNFRIIFNAIQEDGAF